MSVIEELAVFNEHDQRVGVATRDHIHAAGLWHETFHCWLIEEKDGERFVYLQLRSANKKDYALRYDITAAGHLLATETPEDGIREVAEELGIDVKFSELQSIGTLQNIVLTPAISDREWARCYVYKVTTPQTFTLQQEEVAALLTCRLADFAALIHGDVPTISLRDVQSGEIKTVTCAQLVPHPQSYYEAIVEALIKTP